MTSDEQPAPVSQRRIRNRNYNVILESALTGSPILRIVPTDPVGPFASARLVNAFVHEVAADIERRSEDLAVEWVVSADIVNAYVVIDLADFQREALLAYALLKELFAERAPVRAPEIGEQVNE